MTDYEFETELQVRYSDLDVMGHVNNAVYATYLEEARRAYFREAVDVDLAEAEAVLASLSIDFEAPVESDDRVTVALSVPELGESSVPIHYEVRRSDGTVAATAETVMVAYDREAGAPRPIPAKWRDGIEAYGTD